MHGPGSRRSAWAKLAAHRRGSPPARRRPGAAPLTIGALTVGLFVLGACGGLNAAGRSSGTARTTRPAANAPRLPNGGGTSGDHTGGAGITTSTTLSCSSLQSEVSAVSQQLSDSQAALAQAQSSGASSAAVSSLQQHVANLQQVLANLQARLNACH